MKLIFKFIINNIKERKLRTFLIIFSITVSSTLFFVSMAVSDTMTKIYTDRLRTEFGQSDIVVAAKENSSSMFFNYVIPNQYTQQIDYAIGLINEIGLYKKTNSENLTLRIKGINWDDMQKLNPIEVDKNTGSLLPFTGRKIIISSKTAKKYDLNVGSSMNIQINGKWYRFTVQGIAQNAGLFIENGQDNLGVIPRDTLSSIYNKKGNVTTLYISLKEKDNKSEVIEGLSNQWSHLNVKETITKSELDTQLGQLTTSLYMTLIMVIIMSVFIIFTSFKVISVERLPVIGTFRSIGATQKRVNKVFMLESCIYGLIGGTLGSILGLAVLFIIAKVSDPGGGSVTISFKYSQLFISFIVAILLAVISSILPILKVSKIPIKDVILHSESSKKKRKSYRKLMIGIIMLIVVWLCPPYTKGDMGMMIDMLCLALSVISLIFLVPYIVAGFSFLTKGIYVKLFGNIGLLAIKNLRDNKNNVTNISLLVICISGILMIYTVVGSVITETVNFYDHNIKFGVYFSIPNMNRSNEALISSVDHVRDVCGIYMANNIEMENYDGKIVNLQGVNVNRFLDFYHMKFSSNPEEMMKELDSGRNIIVSGKMQNQYGWNKGDLVTLKIGTTDKTYKIIGLMDTLYLSGNYAIISDRYFTMDMKATYYTQLAIKTNINSAEMLDYLKNKFVMSDPEGQTVSEIKYNDVNGTKQMFSIMNAFMIILLIVGMFAIFNNLIISFIERKRSIAVYRSIGMSKNQVLKMVLIEALSSGMIGGIAGVISGLLMTSVMSYLIRAMYANVTIQYSIGLIFGAIFIGIFITIFSSLSPALKSSKLNLIEAIKYE